MSAGDGVAGLALGAIQVGAWATGPITVIDGEAVTFGREQHEQEWQFGAHWPPEMSVGQLSSQSPSPHNAASPLTSNVSRARKTTTTARRTGRVSHKSNRVAWGPGTLTSPPMVSLILSRTFLDGK